MGSGACAEVYPGELPGAVLKELLGVPYKKGGRDESGCDCYGFVRLAGKKLCGLELPELDVDRMAPEKIVELIEQEGAVDAERINGAEKGAIVVLRIAGSYGHVGLCLDNKRFVHALEKVGVSVDTVDSLRWRSRVCAYYRVKTG